MRIALQHERLARDVRAFRDGAHARDEEAGRFGGQLGAQREAVRARLGLHGKRELNDEGVVLRVRTHFEVCIDAVQS